MGKSVWTIAVLGFIGVLFMGIFAFMAGAGLKDVNEKKGKWFEMASKIKQNYNFRAVKVVPVGDPADKEPPEITVTYETTKYLSFNERELDEELQNVLKFCLQSLPAEREGLKSMKLVREEITGGGCSERHKLSERTANTPPPPIIPKGPRVPEKGPE